MLAWLTELASYREENGTLLGTYCVPGSLYSSQAQPVLLTRLRLHEDKDSAHCCSACITAYSPGYGRQEAFCKQAE